MAADAKMTDVDFRAAAAAGDVDAVNAALAAGQAVDAADGYGNTALMIAAARGRLEVCKALIDAGADPNHANRFGLGPRQWADWAENAAPIRNLLG